MGDVSLRPDGFAEGGGLIDDFDGIISDIRFVMTDYDGAMSTPVPVARVVFNVDGEETEPTLYSVGGKDDFAPDESGMGLIKLKSKNTLTKKAKFPMLLASFIDVGFPLNKMDGDSIGYLVGLDGHFLRKAVEFKGIKRKDERESTVLLCTKINQLPWESKKGRGKGKKAASDDDSLSTPVASCIGTIIIGNGGDISKKDMLSILFKDDSLPSNKRAALKLASDDTFLNGRDEWSYENGVLKMV